MSSVVEGGLVSVVLTPDLASVVRRGASASARYMGVFVVDSVVVNYQIVMILSCGDRNRVIISTSRSRGLVCPCLALHPPG